MSSNIVKYNPRDFKTIDITLGDEITVYGWGLQENCRFVKVTRKGLNILNLDTNRMLFRRHLYSRKMVGKEYPERGNFKVKVQIPRQISIISKKGRKTG